MKHLTTRRLAAGASVALAAGVLVAGTTSGANAAPVTTDYSCSNADAGLGPWAVSVDSEIVGISAFPTIAAGLKLPADAIDVTNHFTIPNAAYTALTGASVENIAVTNYVGNFGSKPVGVHGMTATVSGMTQNPDNSWSTDVPGKNDALEVPKAGNYDILAPATFTMVATTGLGDVPVSCVLADGASQAVYHNIDVLKNASTTKASVVKPPVEKGTRGKLNVTVTAPNHKPTGKVVALKGDKTIGSATLSKGKATIKLDKLKPGKYKVTVKYKGDGYTKTSKTSLTVKVVN